MSNWNIKTGKVGSPPFSTKRITVLEAVYLFFEYLEEKKIPKIEVIRKGRSALTVTPWDDHHLSPFTEYRLTVNGVDKSLTEIDGDWLVFNVKDGKHTFEKGFSSLTSVFDWYLTERRV